METHQLCAAVVPCFNEARTVGTVVRRTLQQVRAVWVIDDGSSDETRAEAERAGAVVIRHEVNLGKGASIRDGLSAARAAGYTFATTLDGDGQHDPAEIPKFIAAARNGADLVIGDRTASNALMTPIRRFVNGWMSGRLGRRLGIELPDSQCGFRLIRLGALAGLNLRQNRFEVESEMLTVFMRAGLKVVFVPVQCLRAQRKSRIRPVVDSIRWLKWWLTTK